MPTVLVQFDLEQLIKMKFSIREMSSYSLTIIAIQVLHTTFVNGRDCNSYNHIERTPEHGPDVSQKGDGGGYNTEPSKRRKKCCPYDFDSKRCQVINDRLLCGYNRNVGKPADSNEVYSLSKGCRLRGGRLECGYEHPPFTNPRRPPGWDAQYVQENEQEETFPSVVETGLIPIDSAEDIPPMNLSGAISLGEVKHVLPNLDKQHLSGKLDNGNLHLTVTSKILFKTKAPKCVEIGDRFVCKPT